MRLLRCFALAAFLYPLAPASAGDIVLPVSIYVIGSNESLWATEVRAMNHTSEDLTLHVTDFLGSLANLSFVPGDYVIPAGQSRAFGAYNLVSPELAQCFGIACGVGIGNAYFGAFVLHLDQGLTIEAAILTGSSANIARAGFPLSARCMTWEGGYVTLDGVNGCVEGAGPLFQNEDGFQEPGAVITLDWLHTQPSRRTNVSFYNPDSTVASVTLRVSSSDGVSVASQSVMVPGHSVAQVNDIFAIAPFDAIRSHNGTDTAAASAVITSSTRLYAIGWVISNLNNTVTISTPK